MGAPTPVSTETPTPSSTEAPTTTPTSAEAPSSLLAEDSGSPALKAAAKPKRGAKKGKAKVERVAAADIPEPISDPCGTCKKTTRGITWDHQVEGGEISEEEATEPAPVAVVEEEQPERGGRRKLALAEVETAEEVNVEAPVKKRGRKKAVVAIEEEAVASSPVKRGRRGAAPVW